MSFISEELVKRLYNMALSLNDTTVTLEEPRYKTRRELDKGDHVIRFVFRELLL